MAAAAAVARRAHVHALAGSPTADIASSHAGAFDTHTRVWRRRKGIGGTHTGSRASAASAAFAAFAAFAGSAACDVRLRARVWEEGGRGKRGSTPREALRDR